VWTGTEINVKKTKVIVFSNEGNVQCNIKVNEVFIEQVASCRYRGNLVTEDGRSRMEIKTRIAPANEAF